MRAIVVVLGSAFLIATAFSSSSDAAGMTHGQARTACNAQFGIQKGSKVRQAVMAQRDACIAEKMGR